MKRKIIKINSDKCNGCGACVKACHEGAIEMINGKARLISDKYCDGLGDCLPACPTDAIEIIEREAEAFDEIAGMPCGCPGTMAKRIDRGTQKVEEKVKAAPADDRQEESELRQWPVQMKLVNSSADYLNEADLLVAADCTAYAYKNFHADFIKDHVTIIGCPKLDDVAFYEEKLVDILKRNIIKSITVVRMEVPCCSGIVSAVKEAMLRTKTIVPYREVVITVDGKIK